MRPVPVLVTLALALSPDAALAQDPAPEEPVGPVSYHAYEHTGEPGEEAPRSTPVDGGGTRVELLSRYVPRNAAEPTVGIDRQGRAFYAAGAFDAGGVNGAAARTEIFRSTDGGVSWQETTPMIAGQDMAPTTLDPFVWVDQVTDRVFSVDLYLAGSYISYSDDAGATWKPTNITAPGVNDHQTFFTGPKPKGLAIPDATPAYPTMAYYCVNAITHVACSRSTDGGVTFQPLPSAPFTDCIGCQTGHGVVDKDGRVFLPRGEFVSLTGNDRVEVAISEDGGESWEVVTIADGERSASQRHTSIAADAAGNLYYTWFDNARKLPWLAISTDHGQTWDKQLMVAPPGVHDVNFPVVVAGDEGRVALAFPGSSVDAQSDTTKPWHAWVVVTEDALADTPVFHAAPGDDGTDPLHRGICNGRCAGMYDFIDIEVSPVDGSAWATFTDTCTGACVATRANNARDAKGMSVRTIGGPSLYADRSPVAPAAKPASAFTGASPVALPDRVAPRLALTAAGAWTASEPVSLEVARDGEVLATTGRPALAGRLPLAGLGRVTIRATDRAGNTATRTR